MELTVDSWLIFKERCKREKEKHCLHIRSAKPYQQQLHDSNEREAVCARWQQLQLFVCLWAKYLALES